jgi:hypothetical protein
MAASDHIHPQQLAMLMPARQLYGMHSLDTPAFSDVDAMRGAKRRVNSMSKLSKVGEEGIRKPVQIAHGNDPGWRSLMGSNASAVANGNHRVTAAYDANPDMEVPVEHYDRYEHLVMGMRRQDREGW